MAKVWLKSYPTHSNWVIKFLKFFNDCTLNGHNNKPVFFSLQGGTDGLLDLYFPDFVSAANTSIVASFYFLIIDLSFFPSIFKTYSREYQLIQTLVQDMKCILLQTRKDILSCEIVYICDIFVVFQFKISESKYHNHFFTEGHVPDIFTLALSILSKKKGWGERNVSLVVCLQ